MSKYIYCPLSLPGPRPFSRPPSLRAVFLSAATAACQPPLLPLSYGYYPLVRTRRAQLCEKCSLSSLPPSLSLSSFFSLRLPLIARVQGRVFIARRGSVWVFRIDCWRDSRFRIASRVMSLVRERERWSFPPPLGPPPLPDGSTSRKAERGSPVCRDAPRRLSRQPGSREVNLEVILWASAGRRYPPDTRRPARGVLVQRASAGLYASHLHFHTAPFRHRWRVVVVTGS